MPVVREFQLPSSAQDLPVAESKDANFFLCFISSTDPATSLPWCPDVRAALPHIEAAFASEEGSKVAYVHAGQKPEWKDLGNEFRKSWGVKCIPTLIKYQRVNGDVRETGRLQEAEILDEKKLQGILKH